MAQILYAALGGSSTTSDLYTVDPVSGVMTSIGPIGFAVTGLAFRPSDGILFGSTSNNSASNPGSLITIDTSTGAGTLVGAFSPPGPGGQTASDLAFDATDQLWGWSSRNLITTSLWKINTSTGAVTAITDGSQRGGGALDFDAGGTLWHVDLVNVNTVDTTTAVETVIVANNGDFPKAGKFDQSGTFWAVGQSDNLATVNLGTGNWTNQATFSLALVDAIAWSTAVATDFVLHLTPSTLTIGQGASDDSALTTTVTGGDTESIALSSTGPTGMTISITPGSITAGGSGATIHVAVGAFVAPGTYLVTIHGVGTSNTHTAVLTVVVPTTTVTPGSDCESAAELPGYCNVIQFDNSALPTTDAGSDPLKLVYGPAGETYSHQAWFKITNTGSQSRYLYFITANPGVSDIHYAAAIFQGCACPDLFPVENSQALNPETGFFDAKFLHFRDLPPGATSDTVDLGVVVEPHQTIYLEIASSSGTWTMNLSWKMVTINAYDSTTDDCPIVDQVLGEQTWPASVDTYGIVDTPLNQIHALDALWTVQKYTYEPGGSFYDISNYPPAGDHVHALIVTRVPDDGSTVDQWFVDLPYTFDYSNPTRTYDFGTGKFIEDVCRTAFRMTAWDAQLASDGTTVWLAAVAEEDLAYPFETNEPSHTFAGPSWCITSHSGPATVLFGDPIFGPDYIDAGGDYSTRWWPGHVYMFVFDGVGFTQIGTVDAEFDNNGSATSFFNGSLNDSFYSGVELAASPAEPGVCHMLWSECGGYGSRGQVASDPLNGNFPNRGYRLNYSRWDSGAKTLDVDAWRADVMTTAPISQFAPDTDFLFTPEFLVRNDHGWPVAFVSKIVIDSDAYDRAETTIRMWDLRTVLAGNPTELQEITSDLLPTPAENQFIAGGGSGYTPTRRFTQKDIVEWNGAGTSPIGLPRGIAVSNLYSDPLLGGQQVYLLGTFFQVSMSSPDAGLPPCEGYYRVPADGSAPFTVLDGDRSLAILPNDSRGSQSHVYIPNYGTQRVSVIPDFFLEVRNLWMIPPAAATGSNWRVNQLDRICNHWWIYPQAQPLSADLVRFGERYVSYHDSDDRLFYVALASSETDWGFSYVDLCRDCQVCTIIGKCGEGFHIWQRT